MMIQDGDILLCMGSGPIPQLIQWGTGSQYSHVAVIASAKLELIVEAVPEGGVRAISVKNYKTPYEVYRVKPSDKFNCSEVVSFLIKMLARKYDYPLKLAAKLAMRKLRLVQLFGLKLIGNKKAADKLQEDQDYFCSELCYEAFKAGGLDIVPQIGDAETTSPGDIARSPIIEKIV
jgi:uncharacterized protein YycO